MSKQSRHLLFTVLLILLNGCNKRPMPGSALDAGIEKDLALKSDQRNEPKPRKKDKGITDTKSDKTHDTEIPAEDSRPSCGHAIGTLCNSASDCCGDLECVDLPTGITVCTEFCEWDDPDNPLTHEEIKHCPDRFAQACADFDPPNEKLYCLPSCTPGIGKNSCPSGTACDPRSTLFTTDPTGMQDAACAYPACKSDKDCPVKLAEECDPAVNTPQCTASPAGAFCASIAPGSTEHYCSLPGSCDKASGLCLPHKHGEATAKVGDPCSDSRDCAGNMLCMMEKNYSGSDIVMPNGYCTISGCAFAASNSNWNCPTGSTCNHMYYGGACFKTCDMQQASDCRSNANDKYGDYDCYALDNFMINGMQITNQPVCAPVSTFPCSLFQGIKQLNCSHLGLAGNPTQMHCRDLATGSQLPDNSSQGFCMDLTASGN